MSRSRMVNGRQQLFREDGLPLSIQGRRPAGCWMAVTVIAALAAGGCGDVNAALAKLSEARHLAADLQVQFTKGADASNRAVMADTDEASVTFAREAEQAIAEVQKTADALKPLLVELAYSSEVQQLDEFATRFSTYRELDRRILDLAVENTNLKAQRLAFGPGEEAADEFRDLLKAVVPASPERDAWHVEALAATAVATLREIQVLQAPHIANADESVMTRMEQRMAASETTVRKALQALLPIVQPASRTKLATATTALDRFMSVNAEIIALSRRNTNVRSLALSLDEKRALTAACEESVRGLRDALAKRGYAGSR